MIIRIEPDADLPIYTQLVNQLIETIARRDLAEGDSLPSVRSLAADLSMNMHTVNKAYHTLEQKGIIQIIPKSGAVVNAFKNEMDTTDYERLKETISPLVAEAIILGMDKNGLQTLLSTIISNYKGDM